MLLLAIVVLVDHCTNNIYITFYYDYDFKISVSWNAKASVKISFNTIETASID